MNDVASLWHLTKKDAYPFLPLEQRRTLEEDENFFREKLLPTDFSRFILEPVRHPYASPISNSIGVLTRRVFGRRVSRMPQRLPWSMCEHGRPRIAGRCRMIFWTGSTLMREQSAGESGRSNPVLAFLSLKTRTIVSTDSRPVVRHAMRTPMRKSRKFVPSMFNRRNGESEPADL